MELPSSNLMLDRKGKGAALQSLMWNIKYPMYLDHAIMIPKAFLFTSRPIKCLNSPRSVMENAFLKPDLMLLYLIAETLVMNKSSTYRTINSKEPAFYCM